MINIHSFADELEKIAISRKLLSEGARVARSKGNTFDLLANGPFGILGVAKKNSKKSFRQATRFNKAIDKKDRVGLLGRIGNWFEDGGYKGGKDRG